MATCMPWPCVRVRLSAAQRVVLVFVLYISEARDMYIIIHTIFCSKCCQSREQTFSEIYLSTSTCANYTEVLKKCAYIR